MNYIEFNKKNNYTYSKGNIEAVFFYKKEDINVKNKITDIPKV